MELDFDQLRRLKESFHDQFRQGGAVSEQLNEGSMVYSIEFYPDEGAARVHVQWPYFRDLVANDSDYPATYTVLRDDATKEPWIHWTCSVLTVEINACMYKSTILDELKSVELPEDCELDETDDIEDLLILWMNLTGWNMPCS